MAERRDNRAGEWRSTLWVFLPLLTLGWLGGVGLIYAGMRAHHRRWALYGIVYLVVGLIGFALVASEPEGDVDTWRINVGTALSLAVMALCTAHAFAIRRAFVERTGRRPDPRLQEAERRLAQREEALAIVRENPVRARELGIGRPDLPDAFDGGLVDLNHADAAAIARLPRVDPELAGRIVALREELEGFDSLEDAGAVLDLPASTVERLRGRAVCLPY